MSAIRVERQLEGPIDAIFEILSDHASYDRFRGIRHSELLRPGDSEPNGLGALRRIKLGPLVFEEEITAFEPPTRMDYVIRKLNVPFEHDGGSIRLEPRDGGTHALWTSTFRIPVAVIGGPTEVAFKLALTNGFTRLLKVSSRLAAEGEPVPA
jgi:uncharacterized protein YndB with AHSA1/START domain